MTLKYKKYIPYFIAAFFLILLATVLVLLINANRDDNTSGNVVVQEETTDFIHNGIPYYHDIPASTFEKELFRKEDGRIVYTGSNAAFVTGIDVSTFQGDIDWQAVADDDIDFAIIRAGFRGYGSEGKLCEDEKAIRNIENALDAGLDVGVYFFSQAITVQEAIDEANFLIDIIEGYDITYPVFFDWENEPDMNMRTDGLGGSMMTDCAVAFCETVRSAGFTPGVYFNLSFGYERYNLSRLKDYVFWYAQYKGDSPEFYYNYSIWQYTPEGSVDGIDGKVDMNISFMP